MIEAILKNVPIGQPIYQNLKSVTTPKLIWVGRHDNNTGIPMSEKIHEFLPHSKPIIFVISGQFPSIDEEELFKTTIYEFIKNWFKKLEILITRVQR